MFIPLNHPPIKLMSSVREKQEVTGRLGFKGTARMSSIVVVSRQEAAATQFKMMQSGTFWNY
ncbi:hypothetical protein FRX31_028487 [Thalictrum thalictroides]|uniref:Uncharacterized protein n=1 Tax=Thalictrum thalictroides TaxID=46969 RepID=A0A7J6VAD6_THATH|nr:hypothetical protein FRX31_028487 [Thalictrum thalictroides]